MPGTFYFHETTPHPLVAVHDSVRERLGPPRVDYDGLSELYYGDLSLPTDVVPTVKLRPLSKGVVGYHLFLSRSVHIDPIKTADPDNDHDLIEVFLHESRHLADAARHPVAKLTGTATRLGVWGLGTWLTSKGIDGGPLPDIGAWSANTLHLDGTPRNVVDAAATLSVASATGGRLTSGLYYAYLDILERRARATQNDPDLRSKYANVIQFPPAALVELWKRNQT